jgi:hypothetical protein
MAFLWRDDGMIRDAQRAQHISLDSTSAMQAGCCPVGSPRRSRLRRFL